MVEEEEEQMPLEDKADETPNTLKEFVKKSFPFGLIKKHLMEYPLGKLIPTYVLLASLMKMYDLGYYTKRRTKIPRKHYLYCFALMVVSDQSFGLTNNYFKIEDDDPSYKIAFETNDKDDYNLIRDFIDEKGINRVKEEGEKQNE